MSTPQEISNLLESMNGASDTDEAWEIAKHFGIEVSFPDPSDFACLALDGSVWLFVSLGTGWEVKPTTMAEISKDHLDRIQESQPNWIENIPAPLAKVQPHAFRSGRFAAVMLKDGSVVQHSIDQREFLAYPSLTEFAFN